MFDLSKDVSSGTVAVWLVPIGSFQGQITYYQLGHPEGRVPFGGAGNGHAYLIGKTCTDLHYFAWPVKESKAFHRSLRAWGVTPWEMRGERPFGGVSVAA